MNDTLPNHGVRFCLGSYRIVLDISPLPGYNRTITVECPVVSGLYVEDLLESLQKDIDKLKIHVHKHASEARKERIIENIRVTGLTLEEVKNA